MAVSFSECFEYRGLYSKQKSDILIDYGKSWKRRINEGRQIRLEFMGLLNSVTNDLEPKIFMHQLYHILAGKDIASSAATLS